ncbi:MAG: ATPase, T2SS/T4P/T4SS family [Thermoproteota archaeon]
MSCFQHTSLCADIGRTWIWSNIGRTLYLFYPDYSETNPQVICDIMHKLMYFTPQRVLISFKDHWYDVCKEYLDSMKKYSREAMKEKTGLYRMLSEKYGTADLDLNDAREKLSIRPFYGSVYSKLILQLPLPSSFLVECQLQEYEKIFKIRSLGEHNYFLGHLSYGVDAKKSSYRISFKVDDFFWIKRELSTILHFIYSEKMLRTGKLKDIVEYRFEAGLKFLKVLTSEEMDEPVKKSLVEHAVYSSMGLSKIYPLINDGNVQCFFLDDVGRKIYVDHAFFGRLNTNLILKEKDFESLVTLVKRETGLNLDYSHPSIKASIVFNKVLTRVSIDAPPLTLGRGVIDVRKHVVNTLSLRDLLGSEYFSIESAAFLIFAILNRANISIIGEPNSGKTSLLNFLSYFMPSWWRIVHIEDALETLPPKIFNQHRVVYIVDPFESGEKGSTKTLEIVKVLHRTPSYLILGEIQTKGHVKAMFHAISAGLRVMHTAHASSNIGFIKRLAEVHNIPRLLISELDLIILMKKLELNNSIKRFIGEIVEVNHDSNINKLFSRNTVLEEMCCQSSLKGSEIFERLARLNCIEEKFLYGEYEEIEKTLRENRYSENTIVNNLIQKIHSRVLGKSARGSSV